MISAFSSAARGFQGYVRWPIVRVSEVASLHYGKALTAASRKAGDVPVYGSNGQCGWHDKPLSNGPTVILGRKGQGPLGVEWCPGPFWVIDTAYYVSVSSSRIDLKYFYYLIKYVGLNHLKDGTSNPSLSRDVFGRQGVPLPPLPTQRRIASILSAYDDLIENNTRRIAILEEMARHIYEEWFVRFRFPGHENVRMVESEPGAVPEGWRQSEVKDVVKRLPTGKVYREAEVKPHGAVPVIDQSTAELLGFHEGDPGYSASSESPVVIFGDHTCKMQLLVTPFSLGPNTVPFVAEGLPVHYVYSLVRGLVTTHEYKRHWSDLMKKRVLVAPQELTVTFEHSVRPMTEMVETLRKKTRVLRSTRDLLLPKLICGELDVSSVPGLEAAVA